MIKEKSRKQRSDGSGSIDGTTKRSRKKPKPVIAKNHLEKRIEELTIDDKLELYQ